MPCNCQCGALVDLADMKRDNNYNFVCQDCYDKVSEEESED